MTHDCCARLSTNQIVTHTDDTTVQALVGDDNEEVYRKQVRQLVDYCNANKLVPNVDKTKEIITD